MKTIMTREVTIKSANIESEVKFYEFGELQGCSDAIQWTLTIEASDNKRYIYSEDEQMYPTYDLVKDYFLGEVHSDLGETAYYQLSQVINKL